LQFFILKNKFTILQFSERAAELFLGLFSKKILEEAAEFLPGFETDEKTIKAFLIEAALSE
jgi:hypothetical protein